MNKEIELLTSINLDDLVSSFGWQDHPFLRHLLRMLFLKPAKTFAEYMVEFDKAIAQHGLVDASRLTQKRFVQDIRVFGLDLIPDSAFLALSNHPGMSDTLSVFCALNRPNLKIIALDRPFLNALPNMSKQLFYLREDTASRVSLVRQVTSHLRNGGAALTFPAGQIEPDPDVYPGAVDSLKSWVDSAGVFIRLAPETAVLPIVVRSVMWDKAVHFPLVKIKKTKDEKEKLVVALQLLSMIILGLKPVTVTVQIGRPITAKTLGTTDAQIVHQAILSEMKQLIEKPPAGGGTSVL